MTYAARTIESSQVSAQPDLSTIKSKMKATWEDGDYANFATYMEPGAVEILEDWNITPGLHAPRVVGRRGYGAGTLGR